MQRNGEGADFVEGQSRPELGLALLVARLSPAFTMSSVCLAKKDHTGHAREEAKAGY